MPDNNEFLHDLARVEALKYLLENEQAYASDDYSPPQYRQQRERYLAELRKIAGVDK